MEQVVRMNHVHFIGEDKHNLRKGLINAHKNWKVKAFTLHVSICLSLFLADNFWTNLPIEYILVWQ